MKVIGLILLWIIAVSSNGIYRPKYLITYACEGNVLNVQCDHGHTISLIRANYGRFSVSVCNEHGVADWSVNCMSNRSFRVLQDRCGDQNNCTVKADSKIFGDPCPATLKYLEVHYMCIPNTLPVWPTTKTSATSDWVLFTSDLNKSTPKVKPTNHQDSTDTEILTMKETVAMVTKPTDHSTMTSSTNKRKNNISEEYCKPIFHRGIAWNYTRRGEVASIHCPSGASGFAKWKCDDDLAQWTPNNPDLSGCKTAWITSLRDRLDYGESVINVAAELARVTRSNKIYGGDLLVAMDILKKVTSQIEKNLKSLLVINKEDVINELLHCVVETTSNLLDVHKRQSWNDLSKSQQMETANSLIASLKDNARVLADQVNYEKLAMQAEKNVIFSMKISKSLNAQDFEFSTNNMFDDEFIRTTDAITISPESQLYSSDNGFIKIIFFALRNIEDILQPTNDSTHWQLTNDIDDFSQPQFQNSSSSHNWILNSRLVSVLNNGNSNSTLRTPVIITLQHLRNCTNCRSIPLSWNFKTNSWSDNDCEVLSSNTTHTKFTCNHLSSYALTFVPEMSKASPLPAIILKMNYDIITRIGCIICIIFLILSLLTFVILHQLKSDRSTIHKNIIFCLLISELVFAAGIRQTDEHILCGIVAGTLQFFLLSTLLWLFFDIYNLQRMLNSKSNPCSSRWCYFVAYGIPASIILISAFVNPSGYRSAEYCWLQTENHFYISLVGPAVMIILVMLLIIGFISQSICWFKTDPRVFRHSLQDKLDVRVLTMVSVFLTCLLTLTWISAVLYLTTEMETLSYVFAVLNSVLGLYIFTFFCVQNEEVKLQYKKFRVRGCLGCWSTTNDNSSLPDSESSRANCFTRLELTPSEKTHSISRLATISGNLDSTYLDGERSSTSVNYGGFTSDLSKVNDSFVKNQCLKDYWQKRLKSKLSRNDQNPSSHQLPDPPTPAHHVYIDIDNQSDHTSEVLYDEIELSQPGNSNANESAVPPDHKHSKLCKRDGGTLNSGRLELDRSLRTHKRVADVSNDVQIYSHC